MFHLINRIIAPRRHHTDSLYQKIITQARLPIFYQHYGVADTGDGRFDSLALHMILVLDILTKKNIDNDNLAEVKKIERISKELIEVMVEDLDHNFREMGVGDLAVGKRIKGMLKGFYGRMKSYQAGFQDETLLKQSLTRNLYRKIDIDSNSLDIMSGYIIKQCAHLQNCDIQNICAGDFSFYQPQS